MESLKLMYDAISQWNELADKESKIGKKIHLKQINAFIIGKGEECTIEDIHIFICNDLVD
jgi:hypothetical protein